MISAGETIKTNVYKTLTRKPNEGESFLQYKDMQFTYPIKFTKKDGAATEDGKSTEVTTYSKMTRDEYAKWVVSEDILQVRIFNKSDSDHSGFFRYNEDEYASFPGRIDPSPLIRIWGNFDTTLSPFNLYERDLTRQTSEIDLRLGAAFTVGEKKRDLLALSAGFATLSDPMENGPSLYPTQRGITYYHDPFFMFSYSRLFPATSEDKSSEQIGAYLFVGGTKQLLPDTAFTPYPTNDVGVGGYYLYETPEFKLAADVRLFNAWLEEGYSSYDVNIEGFNGKRECLPDDLSYCPMTDEGNVRWNEQTAATYAQAGGSIEYDTGLGKIVGSMFARLLLVESEHGSPAEAPFWPAVVAKYIFPADAITGFPTEVTLEGMASTSLFNENGYGKSLRTSGGLQVFAEPSAGHLVRLNFSAANEMPYGESYSTTEKFEGKWLAEAHPWYRFGGWATGFVANYAYTALETVGVKLDIGGEIGATYSPSNQFPDLNIFAGIFLSGSFDKTWHQGYFKAQKVDGE